MQGRAAVRLRSVREALRGLGGETGWHDTASGTALRRGSGRLAKAVNLSDRVVVGRAIVRYCTGMVVDTALRRGSGKAAKAVNLSNKDRDVIGNAIVRSDTGRLSSGNVAANFLLGVVGLGGPGIRWSTGPIKE